LVSSRWLLLVHSTSYISTILLLAYSPGERPRLLIAVSPLFSKCRAHGFLQYDSTKIDLAPSLGRTVIGAALVLLCVWHTSHHLLKATGTAQACSFDVGLILSHGIIGSVPCYPTATSELSSVFVSGTKTIGPMPVLLLHTYDASIH
jgi:hypothetical protein